MPENTPKPPRRGNSLAAAAASPQEPVIVGQQEFEDKPARLPENEDTTANPKTGLRNAKTVVSQVASNQPLLAREYQKLSVGCQNFTDCILILSSGVHAFVYFLDQMFRDVLDVLLAIDHEGQ